MIILAALGVAIVVVCALALAILRVTDRPKPQPTPPYPPRCHMHGCLHPGVVRVTSRADLGTETVRVCLGHHAEGCVKLWWVK